MNNARKAGLGLLFAVIGFFIGRTYLPATPDKTLALSSLTARPAVGAPPATVATPIPVAPASPTTFTPVADPNAYPTPYPTPNEGAIVVTTQPVPVPVNSSPSLYPTPYPTPSGQALVTSATPAVATTPATPAPIAVNRAPAPVSAPAPMNYSLEALLDRQSHLVYLILALLAVGILYRMRSNEPAVCVAMLIVGLVLGHYIDPGPINIPNPFNRVS